MNSSNQKSNNSGTERTVRFSGSILFDNIRTYSCPACGTIMYLYDDDRLVFTTTHRNTFLHSDKNFYFVPRCPPCEAEMAHMLKAVELMKRKGD